MKKIESFIFVALPYNFSQGLFQVTLFYQKDTSSLTVCICFSAVFLHFLHVFRYFVRVEHTRYGHLEPALVILSLFQCSFAFLQEKIRVILPCEFADLNKEIPKVLLEGGDVLVEVEQALNGNLDLVVGQVGECRPQKVCNKVLKFKTEIFLQLCL